YTALIVAPGATGNVALPGSLSVGGAVSASSFSTGSAFTVTGLYIAGGGTAQAQTVMLSSNIASLGSGLTFCFLPAAANTAAAPGLVVTGASAFASKPVTKLGATALVANDMTTAAVACVIYDGTEYQLQNPQTATYAVSPHAIVFSDMSNTAYTTSQVVGVLYVPVAGTIPTGGTAT